MKVKVTPALIEHLKEIGYVPASLTIPPEDEFWQGKVKQALADGTLDPDTYSGLSKEAEDMTATTPEKVFGGSVNVKATSGRYGTTRYEGKHVKTREPVFNPLTRRNTELPSELDLAKAGALFKFLASRAGLGVSLSEDERQLLDEMAETDEWAGMVGGEYSDKIPGGSQVKALLDDSTSGGIEITPVFFDDAVITFPLLTGELLPRVDLRQVPRGRRIEGGSISTPTVEWGQGDNVEASLFTTTDLVAELNSTIFGVAVAIEIGRDFLSDSGVAVGQILTALVGERLSNELDKVIANGNGTDRPSGLFQASGVGTVTADNGAGGPPTLDDYTDLLFGIEKQYRSPAYRPTFVSNDTTFQRSRQIKIDTASPSTDQRPALAPLTEINTYSTLGWPHAIENNLGNTVAAFVALAKYRLYRRAGLEIRFEQGGKELARKNLVLLIARARFGGRLMDANAMTKWTNGQS